MITTPETLELAADLLQIAPEDLGQAVTSKTMGGGVIEVTAIPGSQCRDEPIQSALISAAMRLLNDVLIALTLRFSSSPLRRARHWLPKTL